MITTRRVCSGGMNQIISSKQYNVKTKIKPTQEVRIQRKAFNQRRSRHLNNRITNNASIPIHQNGNHNNNNSHFQINQKVEKFPANNIISGLPSPPATSELSDVLLYLLKLSLSEAKQLWRVFLSLACMFVAKAAGLSAPFYFKAAIDSLAQPNPTQQIFVQNSVYGLLLAFGASRILNGVIKELQYPFFLPVGQSISRRLAYHTFSHVLGLDIGFHLDQSSGRLSRVVERGVRAVQGLFRAIVFTFVPTLIELVLVCFLLAQRFSVGIGIGVLSTFVLYIAWTTYMIQRTAEVRNQVIELDNRTTSKAVDTLINFQTVKLFDNSQLEVQQYDENLKEYQDASVQINNLSATLNAVQAVILNGGLTAILCTWVIATGGVLSPGDLVLIQGLLLQLWTPLQFLGFFYRELRNGLIDMGGIFDILKQEPIPDGFKTLPVTSQGVSAEISNVKFSYAGNSREVLSGVNIKVAPGERVAIVGPSGSGKSTILKLLVRLHEPNSGEILLQDIPLPDLIQSSFKKAVAVVPQDTVLFNDTIRENIRYGRPEASDDEVVLAAGMARLHDAISKFPKKYETVVGERGLKLSGGEKQRVAIARAFLREPRLLICDEATSALDSGTEGEIMTQLNELAEGRTSIFVAHRLSTVQNFDRILVMADGRVVEEGSHQELLARGQVYRDMWSMQSAEEENFCVDGTQPVSALP